MKRVLIAAGGTGGHFYPGFAAALEFRRRGWEPVIAIAKDDPARARLESEDIAFLEVDLRGLPRRLGPELFSFAVKLASSLGLLSRAVRELRPALVLGMGGYLSFPVVCAAWRRGVPRAVHEANAVLGLANAAASSLGAALFWGLPPMHGSGTVTGTPVRPALRASGDQAAARRTLGLDPARPVLLAFGGSQGAAALNAGLPRALAKFELSFLQVLHLAGAGKAPDTAAGYQALGLAAQTRDYLDDMGAAYAAADLVVCRSGASTLAELAALRKPSLLVPYPHATAHHQDANALVFERAGAGRRIPEGDGFEERLGAALAELLKSPSGPAQRKAMSEAFERLGQPAAEDATDRLVSALEKLAR